jgi:hypothetical protein
LITLIIIICQPVQAILRIQLKGNLKITRANAKQVLLSEKPPYYFISSENESILFYRRIIAAKTNSTVASCINKKKLLKQDLHSRLLYK